MAIDNTVNLSQVANQYQKNDILTKPQKYQVNPNAVDKTPDKDTVQLSSGLTTKEKVGIAAVATTVVAVTLAILGHNGHLGESVQKFLGGKAKKAAQEMGEHTHTTNTHVEPKPTVKPEPEQIVKPEPEQTVKPEPEQIVKPEPEQTVKPEQKVETKELPSELENIKQKASTIEEMDFNIDGQNTKFEVWKGTQKGSNKGSFVRNLDTGEVFYAKLGGKQSENEILASKLYQLGGIDVPELTSFKLPNGETGLLSKYIPNLDKVYSSNPLVNKGFAMDAFLANWDAVCSGNTLTKGNKAIRIDVGGALDFRARGGKKDFGPVVDEITTLINPRINPEAANIYSTMTREDLIASLQRVADINPVELSHTAPKFSETLIERQNFLKDVLKEVESTPQEDKSMFEYLSAVKKNVVNKREAVGHLTESSQPKKVNKSKKIVEQEVQTGQGFNDVQKYVLSQEAKLNDNTLSIAGANKILDETDNLFDYQELLKGLNIKQADLTSTNFYHGTKEVDSIKKKGFQIIKSKDNCILDGGTGIYLTSDKKGAADYGDVVRVLQDSCNVALIDDYNTFIGIRNLEQNLLLAFTKNELKKGHSMKDVNAFWQSSGNRVFNDFISKVFQKNGYDAIYIAPNASTKGYDQLIVFSPEKIKLI